MITKPAKVPQKEITSVDLPIFNGGLFTGSPQNAPAISWTDSKDVKLDRNGFMEPREKLSPFLPDTIEDTYQKFPVLWEGQVYYFVADDNKVRFCQEGDDDWTDCAGANAITTNNGGQPKFLRVLNNVLVINGKNGDKLAYVSLEDAGWPVVKYSHVDDPLSALTSSLSNLSAGSYSIYYAFNYSGNVGNTKLSPITTISINKTRDQWSTSPSSLGSITLTRPGTAPAGAQYWNLYIAISSTAGSIQDSDMLQLAVKLDLATTTFTDDGTLDFNLGSVAPLENNTDGPRVDQGIVEDGNPILFADQDNPYAIYIGGGGPYAMDFSTSNGGFKAEPEKGTNYYPNVIIGFRTGQGVPALTVLYSNTEGLSKQAVLQQQTVNYGDQSFTVWGVTEQHYGAAGVAAPNSPVNYNGKLLFLSTDGFMSMETQPTIQNVLSNTPVSGPVDELVRTIKNSAMETVVGTGWNNKYYWICPTHGFDTPQQILVLDTNPHNKGVEGNGAWYTMDIPAQWIGVISPQNAAAFVYISQGKRTYKLLEGNSTYDTKGGVNVPFSCRATGPLLGVSGSAHNTWQADVQTMFYILGLIGEITIGVTYRTQTGKLKSKERTIQGPTFVPSPAGGWGDPQWTYANSDQIPGWQGSPIIDDSSSAVVAIDVRKPVFIGELFNEAQWYYRTPVGYNSFKIRAISYEGINLGVRPDLQ